MCLACVCVQRLQGSTKRERQQARVETSLSCRIFPMKIWDIVSGRAGWRGGHPGRSWAPSRAAQPSTGELSSTKSCELILSCPCAPISSLRIFTLDPYYIYIFSGDIDKTQIIIAGLEPTNHKTSYFHISMIKMFPFYKI